MRQRNYYKFNSCKFAFWLNNIKYIDYQLIMIINIEKTLKPRNRGFHLITNEILEAIVDLPETGILTVFIKHSSAGLTINENADPSVRFDFEQVFNKLIPENAQFYTHIFEGADDLPAHIKASLIGSSVTIPISNHKLNLGIWQGIYLGEFRNHGGARKIVISIIS